MKTYRTAQVAEIMGVHPNTVRMYEQLGLIPSAERKENGYRVFWDLHLDVFMLARKAFEIEVLQNGLRKKIVEVVKMSALAEYNTAISMVEEYITMARREQAQAEEAVQLVQQILSGKTELKIEEIKLKRKEAAKYLQISMDTLRNWEMNGLLSVKRKENGYRVYTAQDLNRLKIIRSLRCANYSLEAILRLLGALSKNPDADIKQTLDTPGADDEIISVYDQLLTSLESAANNAAEIKSMLYEIKRKYGNI